MPICAPAPRDLDSQRLDPAQTTAKTPKTTKPPRTRASAREGRRGQPPVSSISFPAPAMPTSAGCTSPTLRGATFRSRGAGIKDPPPQGQQSSRFPCQPHTARIGTRRRDSAYRRRGGARRGGRRNLTSCCLPGRPKLGRSLVTFGRVRIDSGPILADAGQQGAECVRNGRMEGVERCEWRETSRRSTCRAWRGALLPHQRTPLRSSKIPCCRHQLTSASQGGALQPDGRPSDARGAACVFRTTSENQSPLLSPRSRSHHPKFKRSDARCKLRARTM